MQQVVESAVTIPLEQQINGVEGMHYITSTSSNDGTSSINVTFRTGYDLNIAAVDVQNRVATAQGRLPQEIKNTGVTITKANPNFVFAAGFYSPDNSLSEPVHLQLPRRLREGCFEAGAGRRRRASSLVSASTPCASGLTPPNWPPAS